jgi:hypothetical protein
MANDLEQQPADPPSTIAPELRAAWRFSIIQQVAIYFTVFMMNDRSRIYAAVIAHIIYWAGIGFIIFLRRSKPILLDLLFARWSFPLLWLAALVVLVQIAKARVQ